MLQQEGFAVLGTSPDAIDLAEDRGKFARLLAELEHPGAPARGGAYAGGGAARSPDGSATRWSCAPPTCWAGGPWRSCTTPTDLEAFVATAAAASPDHPVLIDRFLEGAIEVDVDAVCDGTEVFIGAVMEHIEEAGVHSGDSSCAIPPPTLSDEELDEVEDITRRLARRLGVRGLLNLQLAVKDERVWVLEANPRASRTVPFVSKVTGVLAREGGDARPRRPHARASCASDGARCRRTHATTATSPYTSVKAAVLPVRAVRGRRHDPRPRDEVDRRGHGDRRGPGRRRSRRPSGRPGRRCPSGGTVFVSVANRDKRAIVFPAQPPGRPGVPAAGDAGDRRRPRSAPASRSSASRR